MTDALSLLPVGALFVVIWVAGELFGLVRAPLVGQIVVGLLLGPGQLLGFDDREQSSNKR